MMNSFFTLVAYAEPSGGGDGVKNIFTNPISSDSFAALITTVLGLMIEIGVPVLVLFIVYAGFKFVTAGGNEQKVTDAKKQLLWALIGGAVLLGAKVIATVIQNTIGVIKP